MCVGHAVHFLPQSACRALRHNRNIYKCLWDFYIFGSATPGTPDLTDAFLFETIFGDTNLTAVRGLETCRHRGPSTLDYRTLAKSGPRRTRWAGTAKPRWPTTLPRMALTTSSIARQSRGGGRRRWLSLGWMRVRPYTSHADTVIAMPPQRPGQ